MISRFDLIKEYKNEKGQTVEEYLGEDKANIIPIGEIIKYDNTVEKGKRITTGKRVNGLAHYVSKEVFVNGDRVSVEVIKHINVEPQFPTDIVGTMEKTTVKQVTTTTPIIAGKVVTEDPTKSASESFNQEGTNGSIVEVVEVTYFNDKETGRKVLSSTTTPATYGKQLIGTK
ncbi:hypothetical protein BW721_08055 [Jeotgalibaca sp. PTS2502]|nr:hypothetical protein BW721_08055 [Jeotgalibaca sp. PTS2502]